MIRAKTSLMDAMVLWRCGWVLDVAIFLEYCLNIGGSRRDEIVCSQTDENV